MGCCLERNDFMFVAYSKRDWERPACENFARKVNDRYNEIVSQNFGQEARWIKRIVVTGDLWSYRVLIPSRHSENLLLGVEHRHRIDICQ